VVAKRVTKTSETTEERGSGKFRSGRLVVVGNTTRMRPARVRENSSATRKKGVRVVQSRVRKKKGKPFGSGRQPRIHAVTIQAREKIVRCPACDEVFAALVEVEPGAFKLEQARHFLGGLSMPTLRRLISRGLLRPVRALRHLTISREELSRYLRENTSS
jgi:Helix-turn-helix domain